MTISMYQASIPPCLQMLASLSAILDKAQITGIAANFLRVITTNAGVSTKELFSLFPKGPAKKVARIAGLGKPEGCV